MKDFLFRFVVLVFTAFGTAELTACTGDAGVRDDGGSGGTGASNGSGGSGGSNGVLSLDPMGPVKTVRFACAVLGGGDVICYGGGDMAARGGDPSASADGTVRVTLPAPALDVVEADSDMAHCALLDDGTVWCWGRNRFGALGDGSSTGDVAEDETIRSVPGQVSGVANAIQLVGGRFFACALQSDGVVKCWGSFDFGPDGSGIYTIPVPLDLPGLVAEISPGFFDPCIRLRAGGVYCADLGDFEEVPEAATAVALRNNCAILADTRAFCWGRKVTQGWGDDAADAGFYPLDDVVDINVDERFSLALRGDGSLWFNQGANNSPSQVEFPCDLTAPPAPKFTRFVGPDFLRGVALFTDDDLMVFAAIAQCGLFDFFFCEGGDTPDWGLFGSFDDIELVFRSDLDAVCEFSGVCCIDGQFCGCLRRANLCGEPGECDEYLE